MYKVLLVDDEAIVCEGLVKFFNWEAAGFTVEGTANSAAQALVFLENNDIDLLITDIKMPVQNGIYLLNVVHEEYSYLKTVVLSGWSEFSFAQSAMRLGALDYLLKPVNFEELENLLHRVAAAIQNDKQNLPTELRQLQRSNTLLSILKGAPYPKEEASQLFSGKLNCLVVRLAPCARPESYEILHHIKGLLCDGLTELFPDCLLCNNDVYEQCAVLCDIADMEAAERGIAELVHRLSLANTPLAAGISNLQTNFHQLHEQYIQAERALRYQKVRQRSGVILYSNIKALQNQELGDIQISEKTLLACFSNPLDWGRSKDVLREVLDELSSLPDYSINTAQIFCMQLLIDVTDLLQTYSLPGDDLGELMNSFLMSILGCSTTQEIHDCMQRHFDILLERLSNTGSSKIIGTVIKDVLQYLQEHFAEDISLNLLADNFFVHPTYLSRLFKEKTGVNFLDYLTEVRVCRAKELLKQAQLKIYDISEMVGYESPRYFSKIFKQYTGKTPMEYRKSTNVFEG